MDHKKAEKEDMHYLVQPRGSGRSWVFRMVTPPNLVGVPNPWDGKPLAKEIKRGLGTRRLPEARKLRDIALGDIRKLQNSLGEREAFSLASAVDWRDQVEAANIKAQEDGDPFNVGVEFVLGDKVEQASARGIPHDQIKRFARVATGAGYPLVFAHSQYVEARRVGNPYDYNPLKRTTVMSLDTAMKHLRAFLEDDAETACLEDVTPQLARRFRDEYLPSIRHGRSPQGLSPQTISKNINLLKMLWVWADENDHLPADYNNPWVFKRGISRSSSQREQVRQDYQPKEFSKLLGKTERGTKEGDLIRLAIATGCRADELAMIASSQVRKDRSGFDLLDGKTKNASRFIPVVGSARELLQARVETHGKSGRVFPEWPVRPASGKAAAVSQWFTRFRRKVLGKETDGRLALHSTRHTWRTVARRAGVDEAAINDLGGWAGPRTSSSVYDHGLREEQLEKAQQSVWDELERMGYLRGY
ncbi:tyrosine-type recombinase/integrase [Litoreibacter albidus]|nr:tyrosine-type recombinase/integrase [Litoreibacter albidus]